MIGDFKLNSGEVPIRFELFDVNDLVNDIKVRWFARLVNWLFLTIL